MTSSALQTAAAALEERYERLPIDQVVPSKTNPRTHFDDGYLAELANSITDKGVLQPIVVRQVDAGSHRPMRFEIVAGECRYRASLLACQTHIPAIIRLLTDEQVLELQLIENLHRRDLTPLEQASGYRRLIVSHPDKHSAASIAQRIGMSEAWVWDRLKLNDLVPEAKAILEQERMTVGHAILIARLKPADQKRVIDPGNGRNGFHHQRDGLWQHDGGGRLDLSDEAEARAKKAETYYGLKAVSIRELDAWIQQHIRFDVEHAAKAQPLAFEETAARVQTAAAQPGRGHKVIAITHEYRVSDDARDEAERTYGSESWQRADGQAKSKTCEYSVLGVIVAGRGQGDTLQVCVNRDKCRVHFGKAIAQREKNQQLRESGKGKQAARVEKKQQDTWQEENRKREEQRRRWELLKSHAIVATAAKVKDKPITSAILAGAVGKMCGYHCTRRDVEQRLGAAITAKTFVRALAILEILQSANTRESFGPIAKRYGVDLAKLEKNVEPKDAPAAPTKPEPKETVVRGGKEKKQAGQRHVDALRKAITARGAKKNGRVA